MRQQVDGLVQLNLLAQFMGIAGHLHEVADGILAGLVKAVVAGGSGIHRHLQDRIGGDIGYTLTLEVGFAAVVE